VVKTFSGDTVYCSELVQKMFESVFGVALAPLKRVGDYDLSDPAVQKLVKKRFPGGLNLDEPAVSPADLLESPLMARVR
jgi:hypothetical protein